MDATAPDRDEIERLRSELSRLERERATEVAQLRSAQHRVMELEAQLAPGGRLIAPVTEPLQRLSLTRRTDAGFERELLEEVRFVPLVSDD